MLAPLLLVSLLLYAAPDWSLYHRASDIHSIVAQTASRNSAAAEARRRGERAVGHAAAGSWGLKDWMRESWVRDQPAAEEEAELGGEEPLSIQLLTAASPHGAAAPLALDLPESDATDLLRSFLQPPPGSVPPHTPDERGGGTAPLQVLFNFGEHGRELISSEIALRLVAMLDMASNAERAAAAQGDLSDTAPPELSPLFTSFLLSHSTLSIIPLLNVWSHERVEEGRVCERKNRQGVDLNRNWDYRWNGEPLIQGGDVRSALRRARQKKVSEAARRDEQYPGPHPFSEPESRLLRDVATAVRPDLFVNFHSGIEELYCGWDHKADLVPNSAEVMRLMKHMVERHCSHCPYGGAGAIGGYMVFGGSMDYIYDTLGCPYSLTVEVFGGSQGGRVSPANCFAYFNPTDAPMLEQTTMRWARMAVEAAYFLVREKKGVEYPFELEGFLKPQHEAEAAKQSPDATPSDAAATPRRNHYLPLSSWLSLLRSLPSLHSHPSLASSPLIPSAPAAPAWKVWLSAPDLVPAPSWNDGCTPFLPALPRGEQGAMERLVAGKGREKEGVLPLFSVAGQTSSADGDGAGTQAAEEALNVLFVAGALWNDLVSTEMLCTWISEAGPSLAAQSSRLKLWVIPSLFAHSRLQLLESPPMHPGFCSASLSGDAKLHLLTHQLYATETLLHVLREVVRPSVVVQVAGERFVSKAAAGGAAGASSSFMHAQAISLQEDSSTSGSQDDVPVILQRLDSLFSSVGSGQARRAGLSWHVQRGSDLRQELSDPLRLRCDIGHIDVVSLLLPTTGEGAAAGEEPSRCPSCVLLIKLYVHGSESTHSDVGVGRDMPPADAPPPLSPTPSLQPPPHPASARTMLAAIDPASNAESAEEAAAAAALAEWNLRVASDRRPPSSYVRPVAPTSPSLPPPSSSPTRSVGMGESASEILLRSSSSDGTGGASADAPPASPLLHWCDFTYRNLAPHSLHRVLALHVEQSVGVLGALGSVLDGLASSGALGGASSPTTTDATKTTDRAATAGFTRPPFHAIPPRGMTGHTWVTPPAQVRLAAAQEGGAWTQGRVLALTILVTLAVLAALWARRRARLARDAMRRKE